MQILLNKTNIQEGTSKPTSTSTFGLLISGQCVIWHSTSKRKGLLQSYHPVCVKIQSQNGSRINFESTLAFSHNRVVLHPHKTTSKWTSLEVCTFWRFPNPSHFNRASRARMSKSAVTLAGEIWWGTFDMWGMTFRSPKTYCTIVPYFHIVIVFDWVIVWKH